VVALPDGLTNNACGATLTVQGTLSSSGTSASESATLNADTHFVVTQTPANFRPLDARDPAANCASGAVGCTVGFQTELAMGQVPVVVAVVPAPDAPPAAWLPGTSTNYTPPTCGPGAAAGTNGCAPAFDPDYVFDPTLNQALVVRPNGQDDQDRPQLRQHHERRLSAAKSLGASASMSAQTLAAQVVAHEAGHWMQQNHALRPGCGGWIAGGKPSVLDWYDFTLPSSSQPPSDTVLIGLFDQYDKKQKRLHDMVECRPGGPTPRTLVTTANGLNPPMPVYSALVDPPVTPASIVSVDNLQYELMDWTPNFALANPAQWHFDLVNLNALCGQNPCPQGSRGQNLCSGQ